MSHDPIDPLLRRLAERRIIVAPTELEEVKPDRLSEYVAAIKKEKADLEAKREAEAEAKLRAQPTTTLVGHTIALNGAGVLNAAAAGIGGGATINGGVADFIRGEIHRGRNE